MLGYMLPVDEKPPPGPGKSHLQLSLGPEASISKDASVSSFASEGGSMTSHGSMTPNSSSEKAKPKVIINGGKHQTLKRVSFGSSKGSMVETLIFENTVQEEPEPSPIPENGNPFALDQEQTEAEREKVRVTFFQQSKPLEVDLPDETTFIENGFAMTSPVAMNETNNVMWYSLQRENESAESDKENPFQPDGDLSREADKIVELIKEGKPIIAADANAAAAGQPAAAAVRQVALSSPPPGDSTAAAVAAPNASSTPKSGANGNANAADAPPPGAAATAGAVQVQRVTIRPDGGAAQVEHVTIKKKPKCRCCALQ